MDRQHVHSSGERKDNDMAAMAATITKELKAWMDRAPFLQAQNALISELAAKYGSTGEAVHSQEFWPRLKEIAARTPGVGEWLNAMPMQGI